MRKFIKLVALAALLFVPWVANAQSTLTTCDGTATNSYVPFYGYYADETQNGQMIYPADSLTDMIGMQINQMVFYVSDYGSWGYDIGSWTVSLGTTTETTLSGITTAVTLTEVYSGAMTFESDNTQMIVSFDNGFVYNGDNLLVQFNHPVSASYRNISFYGVSATGASYTYNGQRDFLPKVTFSYGTPSSCAKPSFATVDSVGPYDVYLRWATGTGATAYDLFYGTENDIATATVVSSIADTTYELTELQPQTTYYAWVRSACGSDSADAKYIGSFTTQMTCAPVTNATLENVSYTAAIISWGYNTQVGFPSEGVHITLVDNTDSTVAPIEVEENGNTYTFTGLASGHGYTAILRNYCQAAESVDTASVVTISFMTESCSELSSDGSTNQYIPTYTYYGNTYSQALYLASEMPNVDTIHGIAFNVVNTNSGNNSNRQFDIYVSLVDTNAFDGNNYFPVDSSMLYVTDFTFSTASAGWQVIPFDNAFVYDGTSNLLIVVNDHTNAWVSAASFASISAPNRGKYSYRDGTPWTPSDMTDGNNINNIPAVRFVADCSVPTCFAPMLNPITDIDTGEITVTWVSTGTESEWVVGIKASSEEEITWGTNATETSYTFTNLTANTAYEIYVGSLCDDDTLMATATARTNCADITLPFFDDFDSYANGAWPPCWHRILNHGTDPSVNAQYHHSGTQSMFLLAVNDTNLFVTPSPIPTSGDNIFVRYQAFMGWSSYTTENKWIQAGVMTDKDDISTFIALDTVVYHNFNNVFEEREFTTASLDPNATYWVAWMYYSTNNGYSSYNRGAIDDVYISEIPQCQHVTDLVVDSATSDGAIIHWTAPEGQTEFFVRVNDGTIESVSGTFHVFTGLEPRTTYTAWVASNCSGEESEWWSIPFTTDCANGSCDITVNSTADYIYSYYCPTLHVWQNGEETATVNAASQSVNVCSGMPVYVILEAANYDWDNPAAIILDGAGDEYFNGSTSNLSTGDTLAIMENPCPTCLKPTDLVVSVIDSNHLEFSWVDTLAYEVSFDGSDWQPHTSPYSTLYNLLPNTEYTFSVRTVCSDEDISRASTITVRTSCGMMAIPFSDGFEGQTQGDVPSCWTVVRPGYGNYPGVSGSAHTGSNGMTLAADYNDSTTIASNMVDLPGDEIHVSFWASVNPGNTLYAGVMTELAHDTTFIPVMTIPSNNATYTRYEFSTSGLNSFAQYYVAFRLVTGSNNHFADIDDVEITQEQGCSYPANLTATPGAHNIDLTWVNNASVSDFIVIYRTGNNAWDTAGTTTDTNYSITGLNAAIMYEVGVGLICNNDTLWSYTSIATTCDLMAVPYFEDFSTTAQGSMPPCWTYDSGVDKYDGGAMWHTWTGNGNTIAVVPALNGNVTKLQITFKAKLGTITEGDGVLIGVADAQGNLLEWLDTLQDDEQSREAFVWFTVYFPEYVMPGGASRVAFGHTLNTGNWFLIDDISIIELPDCYPVSNLTGNNLIDPEATTFTWHPQGFATQWQVYVDTVTVGLDSVENMPESNFITVSDTSYTIPVGAIQGGGIYNFFVRSSCDVSSSDWVMREFGAGTVKMNQSTVADTVVGCGFVVYDNGGPIAGYVPNSSSALVLRSVNVGSQLQIFGGKFGFGSSPATLTVYDGEGTNGTVLYTYNTVDGRDTLMDTILAVTTTGAMTITFSVSGNMCHTGYELYIRCTEGAICPQPTELQANMTDYGVANVTWTSDAPSFNFYHRIVGSDTWNQQTVTTNSLTLSGLTEDTTYEMYVVALCTASDSSTASVVRLLNTHYEEGITPCAAVTNLAVSSVTASSAVVSWTSTASSWEMELTGAGSTNTQTVTTNPYTLTDLAENTQYSVRMRSICSGENVEPNSQWSAAVTFTTPSASTPTYTITVQSNNDNWGTVTGSGTYAEGTEVTLTATAADGYRFVQWNDAVTDNPRTVTVTANATYIATFEAIPTYTITVSANDTAMGSVTGSGTYAEGTQVTLTATANDGYIFVQWNDAVTTNPRTITVTGNANYIATFADTTAPLVWHHVTVNVNDTTMGSVTGDGNYLDGSTATITAVPNAGYRFVQWDDQNTDNPRSVVVNEDLTFTATFEAIPTYTITANSNNDEWGTVTGGGTYQEGTTVTLIATANDGYHFDHWNDGVTTESRVITVTASETYTAYFEQDVQYYNVTVAADDPTMGTVTGSGRYAEGTEITIKATPLAGYVFVRWQDNVTEAERHIVVDGDMVFVAYFDAVESIDNVEGTDVTLFPNPASTTVTIDLSGIEGTAEVSIIDQSGRTVYTGKTDSNRQQVNVSGFAKGAYFVRVTGSNASAVRKLVVK